MSRGKRVILCIGNIKKDCIFRDWQTGLHSSSFNESTNRGFSLHQKFAIVNATPLHPHSVSKSIKKSHFFKKKLRLIGLRFLAPKFWRRKFKLKTFYQFFTHCVLPIFFSSKTQFLKMKLIFEVVPEFI